MSSKVQDKHGEPIRLGDEVYTPIRGGKHQGNVEEIVTSEQEAKDAGVKNPPKVCLPRSRITERTTDLNATIRCCSQTRTTRLWPIIRGLWSIYRRNELVMKVER